MKLPKVTDKIPTKETLQSSKRLKFLLPLMQRSYLWSWERRNVANAAFWSMICAFTPWPLQMIQAACLSILFRTNMPVAVGLVWVTNPISMPFIFYFCYLLGVNMMGIEPQIGSFENNVDWYKNLLTEVWQPFLLGCAISGTVSGFILKYAISLTWLYRERKKKKS